MREWRTAPSKDEEMEDGCSKRKLGKRLPRTAISISIYVDNNWISTLPVCFLCHQCPQHSSIIHFTPPF
ncbi:Uncharacterized protein HZ326_6970 [Fusarium oxysporum f. sp. albedinis]|nr:Uncharacterized protein HZ326_6970 [Fusarium oxysporum f. sp. albedinis]